MNLPEIEFLAWVFHVKLPLSFVAWIILLLVFKCLAWVSSFLQFEFVLKCPISKPEKKMFPERKIWVQCLQCILDRISHAHANLDPSKGKFFQTVGSIKNYLRPHMTQIGLYAQLGNIGRFSVVFLFLKTFPKIFFDTTSLKRNELPTTDLWNFYFRQKLLLCSLSVSLRRRSGFVVYS